MRRNGRVEVSPGFFLIMAVLIYRDRSGIIALSLLACVLHELGHGLMLFICGNGVRLFHLTAFGAVIEPGRPMSYAEEFAAAAAGPCVNLVLAAFFARIPNGSTFAGANLALAIFNLLPVRRLDGARMIHCALCAVASEGVSATACWCLDFAFTVIFASLGLVFAVRYGNITLVLTCLWLIFRDGDEKMSYFQKKYGNRGCQIGIKRLK